MSHLFTTTSREAPAEAKLISHRRLLQAGYIHQVSGGLFALLPLASRALDKIEAIVREEMDRLGGQEVRLPFVTPASLWKESGRHDAIGEELLRFQDRNDKEMVLNMTHEEVVVDAARRFLKSHKQLPLCVYQIGRKYRDEARPRGGLIRMREFLMKDAYSFHASSEDLDAFYDKIHAAYEAIFARCGLPVHSVSSDTGDIGGSEAHEFMAITPGGEDSLVICTQCDYAANREIAAAGRPPALEDREPLEKIATPHCTTIEALASRLSLPTSQLARAVVYRHSTEDRLHLVMIRGDLEVNPIKLEKALGTLPSLATGQEMARFDLTPGYLSAYGLSHPRIDVLVDTSLTVTPNLVGGANQEGYHFTGLNWERDFTGKVLDIARVEEGEPCPQCSGVLSIKRCIEVGNIFKLGTRYATPMKCCYLDRQGKICPAIMGCYGLGIERVLASLVEIFSDQEGLRLPPAIAPFDLHLVALGYTKTEEVRKTTDQLVHSWEREGLSVLLDDREESPGVKFKDADLIGIPFRVTVSPKGLNKGIVEFKWRREPTFTSIPVEEASSRGKEAIALGKQRNLP